MRQYSSETITVGGTGTYAASPISIGFLLVSRFGFYLSVDLQLCMIFRVFNGTLLAALLFNI